MEIPLRLQHAYSAGMAGYTDPSLDLSLLYNRATNYFDVVSCTLMIYDFMLTFSREIDLVWRSRWSAIKVLFLVTRYTTFVELAVVIWPLITTDISPNGCYINYQWTGWTNITGILLAEVILMLRTWAVYERRRSVGIGLGVWTVATWVPNLATVGIFLQSLQFGPIPGVQNSPGIGCHVTAGSSILFISWLLIMVSEAPIMFLMAFMAFRNYRHTRDSAVFRTVFRDGTIFYLYLFILSIANVIVIFTTPAGLINLFAIPERMFHSILTTRIILDLRELGSRKHLGWSTFSAGMPASAVEIEFAHTVVDSVAATHHMFAGGSSDATTGNDNSDGSV
ncbi:uncharacterized protein PHACADRAFT_213010 [Phanerochaete carnosa HHB-10118-sp]|uniref:DUF6533 domain-containing protein n=1 Tax=Phanerochaete carnosa (strain HHB-10118-sp) TaxID=650164 RepID=K5VWX7_PHACS|nr:uncharacterized protein PHACADRAFT_213010 [Phanerochaete carnosa HHB-10118-sp]EKM51109.1 hypothetical protein PHACADRAFT_213010 [Phanerochaete carnosa HHB-10118-sp]